MTRRRVLIVVVALPLLVILGALLYLRFADLSGYRGWVEEVLTDTLGRKVSIAGEFQPRISLSPSLLVEKITLANADGSVNPAMVQVDRLAIEIDLWSLISGPIRVHHLEIQGARVLLEIDSEGSSNWKLELGDGEEGKATKPLEIVVESIELAGFELTYSDASWENPVELAVERLDTRVNESGKLEIEANGRLNGVDLGLTGKVGPLDVFGGRSLHAGWSRPGSLRRGTGYRDHHQPLRLAITGSRTVPPGGQGHSRRVGHRGGGGRGASRS
jgi:uncharacterized protein involved in outer membrane biogenesis